MWADSNHSVPRMDPWIANLERDKQRNGNLSMSKFKSFFFGCPAYIRGLWWNGHGNVLYFLSTTRHIQIRCNRGRLRFPVARASLVDLLGNKNIIITNPFTNFWANNLLKKNILKFLYALVAPSKIPSPRV